MTEHWVFALRVVASALVSFLAVLVLRVMVLVWKDGPGRIAHLRRQGYGIRLWWNGVSK